MAASELLNGTSICDQARGSGRQPFGFFFVPLGLGKNSRAWERYSMSEFKNGRLTSWLLLVWSCRLPSSLPSLSYLLLISLLHTTLGLLMI
ncbi:hypothetical protein EON65_24750 [archaeon]|nr:MAG: hypothetical protein EON65_24750 [archaeon]